MRVIDLKKFWFERNMIEILMTRGINNNNNNKFFGLVTTWINESFIKDVNTNKRKIL